MSVDIYGRTYKGAQYRELVEYATRLVPKRSQEKSEHPDPFVGHPARRGKPMILEWLKHRSEHGKERQKRGLPPRRPSRTEWISSAGEAEVLKQAKKSALSKEKDSLADDSSTIATEDRPVPQNLLELTFPSWTTIVPHQGDSDEHTGVIEELGLPPVPRLRTKGVAGPTKPFAESGLAWVDMQKILTLRELPVIEAPNVRPLSMHDALMEAVRQNDEQKLAWLVGQVGRAPPTAVLWHAVRSGRLPLVQVCMRAGSDMLVVNPTIEDRCNCMDRAALEDDLGLKRNSDALRFLVVTMRRYFPVNPMLDGDDEDEATTVSQVSTGGHSLDSCGSVSSARVRRAAALERNRTRRHRRGDGARTSEAPWEQRPTSGSLAAPAVGSLGFRGKALPDPASMSQRDMVTELAELHGLSRGHRLPGFSANTAEAAAAAAAVTPLERLGSPTMQVKRRNARAPQGRGASKGGSPPRSTSLRGSGKPGRASPGKRQASGRFTSSPGGSGESNGVGHDDDDQDPDGPRYFPRAQDEWEWKAATAGGPGGEDTPTTTVDEALADRAAGRGPAVPMRSRYSLENRDLLALCWELRENGGGHTLLHVATLMGHSAIALALLASPTGAMMLRGRDRLGRTPLHLACMSAPHFRKGRLVRAFLDAGADFEAQDNGGRTALHWACRSEDEIAIIMLLAAGADVCVPTKRGLIPLQCAPIEKPLGWGEPDGKDDPDAAEKADRPLPMQLRKDVNQVVYGYLEQHLSKKEMAAIDAKLISKKFVGKMLLNFQKYDPITKREMTKAYKIRTTNFPYYLYIAGRRPRGHFFEESEEEKKAKKDAKNKKKGKRAIVGVRR